MLVGYKRILIMLNHFVAVTETSTYGNQSDWTERYIYSNV